jgi:hypothetical protein
MKAPPVKQTWIERAVDIHRFHISQLREEPNWTIERTARALNRSVGSVSQDLLIARWLKTHEKQLKRCSSMRDALAWVRLKCHEMQLEELE